jgi:hypothetical protein
MSLTLNASERKGVPYKSLISNKNNLYEPIGFINWPVAVFRYKFLEPSRKSRVFTREDRSIGLSGFNRMDGCRQATLFCCGRIRTS